MIGGLVAGTLAKALLPAPERCARLMKATLLGLVVAATAEIEFVRTLLPGPVGELVEKITYAR